jgi:polyhydroxybutyrate depolymerase
MTDHDLERRLRDFYATEVAADRAPQHLRAALTAIPDDTARGILAERRLLLVLIAAALLTALLVGSAIAVGSGLLRLSREVQPTALPAVSAAPVVTTAHIDVGGLTRDYLVVSPSDVAGGGPLPLFVILHGSNVSTAEAREIGGTDELARESAAVVVYAEAYGNSWNAGTCCRPATTDAIDDVTFLAALVDRLEADYPIDPNREFLGGDGTGGSMAYRAACELSDRFAAVAVVSGPLLVDCNPATPIPVLHIHGTADTVYLYVGGGTACDGPCPSVAQTMERWRQADGCTAQPTTTTNGIVVTTTFSTCSGGVEVEFVKAIGADTTWDRPGIDDLAIMWAFLTSHSRGTASG